jgi:hypothetical protein
VVGLWRQFHGNIPSWLARTTCRLCRFYSNTYLVRPGVFGFAVVRLSSPSVFEYRQLVCSGFFRHSCRRPLDSCNDSVAPLRLYYSYCIGIVRCRLHRRFMVVMRRRTTVWPGHSGLQLMRLRYIMYIRYTENNYIHPVNT